MINELGNWLATIQMDMEQGTEYYTQDGTRLLEPLLVAKEYIEGRHCRMKDANEKPLNRLFGASIRQHRKHTLIMFTTTPSGQIDRRLRELLGIEVKGG
jgi:hypothetical protein